MEGMRTDYLREVPAFEFIVQEWLFNQGKELQRSLGLNPLHQTIVPKSQEGRKSGQRAAY